jgi:hypothetical protein
MPDLKELLSVLEETRRLLALPDNNFDWSSWVDREDALDEIDHLLSSLRSGIPPSDLNMQVLFAPTGPIQEVSLSSGWASEFIELANRFEDALASDTPAEEYQDLASLESCACFAGQFDQLILAKDLGLDSWFAEVSVQVCANCGQHWLRYFYESEAFTRSGRWYLGAITQELLTAISVEHSKGTLEGLQWYFYGGSYYEGRRGRTSGEIMLNP